MSEIVRKSFLVSKVSELKMSMSETECKKLNIKKMTDEKCQIQQCQILNVKKCQIQKYPKIVSKIVNLTQKFLCRNCVKFCEFCDVIRPFC